MNSLSINLINIECFLISLILPLIKAATHNLELSIRATGCTRNHRVLRPFCILFMFGSVQVYRCILCQKLRCIVRIILYLARGLVVNWTWVTLYDVHTLVVIQPPFLTFRVFQMANVLLMHSNLLVFDSSHRLLVSVMASSLFITFNYEIRIDWPREMLEIRSIKLGGSCKLVVWWDIARL